MNDSELSELYPISKTTRPIIRFLHIQTVSGIILLIATGVVMAAANPPFFDFYTSFWNQKLTLGIGDWIMSYLLWCRINDGLMTVFFFSVGLEIKREIVSGEFQDVHRVISPAAVPLEVLLYRPGSTLRGLPANNNSGQ